MSSETHHVTAVQDRLPMSQKVAYGLGGIIPIALFNIVGMLMGLIGNIGLGINLLVLSLVMMVPRIWDAFTDPLMGHISDNTRSRYGRRRPYILWGGIAVCITFVIMWWIPKGENTSQWTQLAFILALASLFFTAVTVFEIPHGALGMEMTADYHERTRLFSARSFIGNVGAMATPWLYMMAQWEFFKGAGGNETEGMRWVSMIVALAVLPCILICYFVCKEGKLEQAQKQERIPFRESIKIAVKNRIFLVLVSIIFMVIIGFHFVGNFSNYITIFYLYGGDKETAATLMGFTGTAWAVTSLVAIFPLNWISARIGKSKALAISIFLMATAQLIKIVCYNPSYPYLILIPTAMLSAGMVMYFTLAGAMVADVCDEEEVRTGQRSEGAYYSVFWWFMKMGMAIGTVATGVLLMACHFDEQRSSLVDKLRGPIREIIESLEPVAEKINHTVLIVAAVLVSVGMAIIVNRIRTKNNNEIAAGTKKPTAFIAQWALAIAAIVAGVGITGYQFRHILPDRDAKNKIKDIDSVLVAKKLTNACKAADTLSDHFSEKQKIFAELPEYHEHYSELISTMDRLTKDLDALNMDPNMLNEEIEKGLLTREQIIEKGEGIIRQSSAVSRQNSKTLLWLRVFEIGIPVLLCLFSFIVLKFYPLNEKRMYQIKEELEQRKAQTR